MTSSKRVGQEKGVRLSGKQVPGCASMVSMKVSPRVQTSFRSSMQMMDTLVNWIGFFQDEEYIVWLPQ